MRRERVVTMLSVYRDKTRSLVELENATHFVG